MDKKRLEELRDKLIKCKGVCNHALETGEDELILALIDAEIARQSVTDEAVRRAIEWAEQERKNSFRYMDFGDADSAALAITALQSYQPTTRKNRIVEEVAISKTETTSEPCEYCRKPIYLKWNVSFIDGYYKLNDDCNYCPNCGRKLVK